MKRMGLLACVLGALFFRPQAAVAQSPPETSQSAAPYLLPQTVFVGDSGRLVVPLGQMYAAAQPFVAEAHDLLRAGIMADTQEMLIRRIELEQRGGNSRLLIDFIPYAPGRLLLPPFEISFPDSEPLTLTGLEVQVASILNPSRMDLSLPAAPLAVPGTSFLIYGTIFLILLFLFLLTAGSFWGRRRFRGFWDRLYRRHLIRAMMRFLRQLGQEGTAGNKNSPGFYLSLLSGELREFLSVFTKINCRSLTAGEFMELPIPVAEAAPLKPDFLCSLFRNWDTLRFSGRNIDKVDLFHALKETERFIIVLDMAEREQVTEK